MHAHETIRKLEEARVMSEQREAEMTDDIENLKKAQGEELEVLESQVQSIEEELIRLREQNKWLQGREQDLIKELRQAENTRDKYKTKTTNQKQRAEALEKEIKKLQSRIDGLVEQHKWEVDNLKSGDDKNKVLTSRLQALQDIQGLIKAHRVRTVT
jgi:chromosome segregation ATPase